MTEDRQSPDERVRGGRSCWEAAGNRGGGRVAPERVAANRELGGLPGGGCAGRSGAPSAIRAKELARPLSPVAPDGQPWPRACHPPAPRRSPRERQAACRSCTADGHAPRTAGRGRGASPGDPACARPVGRCRSDCTLVRSLATRSDPARRSALSTHRRDCPVRGQSWEPTPLPTGLANCWNFCMLPTRSAYRRWHGAAFRCRQRRCS